VTARSLQQVDEPAREPIRANATAKVSTFEKDGKIRVPGVARCIVGTKQDAKVEDASPYGDVPKWERRGHRRFDYT
jgi:hypothetical protein